MKPPGRGAALALAVLAATAGCKDEPKPRPSPPPQPLAFERSTPDAQVKLTLSPAFVAYPDLRKSVFEEGVRQLQGFLAHAQEDRRRLAAKRIQSPRYTRTVAWSLTAATDDMVSARETWFEYTGGAHPGHGSEGLLWDVRQGLQMQPDALLQPTAPRAPLDAALCAAILKAKADRQGAQPAPPGGQCPKWDDGDLVLEPSTVPGRFGGVTFLYDPAVIGPYVEGDYAVTIPLAAFQSALAPDYARWFAGAPRPAAPAARPARP